MRGLVALLLTVVLSFPAAWAGEFVHDPDGGAVVHLEFEPGRSVVGFGSFAVAYEDTGEYEIRVSGHAPRQLSARFVADFERFAAAVAKGWLPDPVSYFDAGDIATVEWLTGVVDLGELQSHLRSGEDWPLTPDGKSIFRIEHKRNPKYGLANRREMSVR